MPETKIKVLMASTSFPRNPDDWQGRFIYDMAQSLSNREDVQLALWAPPGFSPENCTDLTLPHEASWLKKLSEKGGIAHILRSKKATALPTIFALLIHLRNAYKRAGSMDIFHVNWLQNALPLLGIPKPVLVTVLGTDYGLLRKPYMKVMLRQIFKNRSVIISPNAEWMLENLQAHFDDLAKIIPVPFGVCKSWYEVVRSPGASGDKQWLVVSRVTSGKIGSLFNWGRNYFCGGQRCLHLFGPMQESLNIPNWIHYHGSTHPCELRNKWFPKAAGLLTLSGHDEGRPQVMIEAMASGLPVIASDLPAHKDFVVNGTTGFLVRSADELGNALNELDSIETNQRVGIQARKWIRKNIGTWDDVASRYVSLYKKVLGIIDHA